ncbi:hypothetical protein NLJ89_g496 [Agrocybe chaxingu]|uniref:Sas10 C-terminal domain-containing protein n=1 Tax=Agrocybe chaxingu TaxID=84603 RepID=A0A9W8TFY4_9AGAR|nr:hypothetical protein NLJ89_g496 [Agrocybe chaxingu]
MVRKRVGKGKEQKRKPKPLKRSNGQLTRWNTAEDIPMDEEDQFHASRDKILLEGDGAGGHSDDGDEDEVFALKGMDDDDDDDDEAYGYGEPEEEEEKAKKKTKKSKKSKKSKGKAKKSSDDEEESEEEEESWGKGRGAYYSSNADQLESDDEEGNELEEKEATRLQAKMREEMKDEDFGLNDSVEIEGNPDSDDIFDSTPSIILSLPSDKKSLLRHLERTDPLSLALARDWDETARTLQKTRERVAELDADKSDALSLGMIHLHYQALLSYSTMLAFYLHMRSSPKYSHRPALLESHPILQRLLTLKQSLQTLEGLDFAVSDGEDDEDEDEDEFMDMTMDDILADGESVWNINAGDGLEPHELDELLNDAQQPVAVEAPKLHKPPKKKRKVAEKETKAITKPVFDLVEPEFVSSQSSSRRDVAVDTTDAYGDAINLSTVDAADKNARKKSLRFHTSKIESASARRQGARNQAVGGDDDIPYRERKKEKESRLVKEAAIRAKNEIGEALNDDEPEPRAGEKRSRDEGEGAESPDEYYELIKKRSKEGKSRKKAEYDEAHGISRVPLEEDGSGPRSVTRAILSNKGLTPHRPKSVRNPRVKKRQKFEKAKRKLSSQKAVYKGGLSETGGRYDGHGPPVAISALPSFLLRARER